MASVRYVISRLWQEHRKKVTVVGILAWVVVITLAQQRISKPGRPSATLPQGTVAKILPVGGLPVT